MKKIMAERFLIVSSLAKVDLPDMYPSVCSVRNAVIPGNKELATVADITASRLRSR